MRLALLVLAAALPAGAEPLGLTFEGQLAAVLGQDAEGSTTGSFAGGARAGLHLADLGVLDLRSELSWLHWGRRQGTEAVEVSPTFDQLFLAVRAGPSLRRPGVELVPYALAGPALTFVGSEYRVDDPLGRGGASASSSASGVEAGAGYGLGLAATFGDRAGLRLAGRLEGARLHRGSAADMLVQLGVGVAF